VGIYYKHITKPRRDYYATDGIGAPIQLKSMLQPNYSSKALLPPDPTNLTVQKAIPN
jgi:intracellular multiplication protein IcmM